MLDCKCYIGDTITEEFEYESFDVMWDEMVSFAKEHPNHIFIPADDPKNCKIGFCTFWEHPKPGYHACTLGIDISDINLERYFNINVRKYLNTLEGKFPKELDLFTIDSHGKIYQTQVQRIKIAQRIVEVAKASKSEHSQQPQE
jgi:hypothetical protein